MVRKPRVRMIVSSTCLNCVKPVEGDWIQETFFFKFLFFLLSKIINRQARLAIVLAHLGFLPSPSFSYRLLFYVSQFPHVPVTPERKLNVLLFAAQISTSVGRQVEQIGLQWRMTLRCQWNKFLFSFISCLRKCKLQ